jgi:hypothetical protein
MKCETKVVSSSKKGRFRITLLELTKYFRQPDEADFQPEHVAVEYRVAVQHSRKANGEWVNQTIYCTPEEYRDLQAAIREWEAEDLLSSLLAEDEIRAAIARQYGVEVIGGGLR